MNLVLVCQLERVCYCCWWRHHCYAYDEQRQRRDD